MKRLILITACIMIGLASVNGQTLEQRKICALKWALQQAFYNKQEGQQIAHIDVTEYKTLADFQKNKLVSDATKKLTDKSDQSRVSRIVNATAETDVNGAVPPGAKNEYQGDVNKMKALAPAPEPAVETPAETEQEEADNEESQPQPEAEPQVVEVEEPTVQDDEPADTDIAAPTEGMSFIAVALTCLAIYIILSLCLYFFLRSRRNSNQKQEEMVTMEQYRSERLRLIERIKALEIEIEDLNTRKSAVITETVSQEPLMEPAPEPEPEPEPIIEIPEPEPEPEPEPVPEQNVVEPEPIVVEPEPEPEPEPITVEPAPEPTPEHHEPQPQHTLFEQEETPAVKVAPLPDPMTTRMKSSIVMFYSVPVDGVFTEGTSEIEPGRSFYMLKTIDGQNGTFQILNTSENISEALHSLSDLVKPACKILNTVASPVEILAEKPGQVVREGNGWRITTKALVRLI